jgi:predicted transcriptional regulator
MTVMNRLVDKGLLRRTLEGGSYRYQATLDRDAFLRRTSQRIVEDLVADFGEVAIAQFAAALQELDPERLAALARLASAPEAEDHHDR